MKKQILTIGLIVGLVVLTIFGIVANINKQSVDNLSAQVLSEQYEVVTIELMHGPFNGFDSLEVVWSKNDAPPDFEFVVVTYSELRTPVDGSIVATQTLTSTDYIIRETDVATPTIGFTIDINWSYENSIYGQLESWSKVCFEPNVPIELWFKDQTTGEYRLAGAGDLCTSAFDVNADDRGYSLDKVLTWPKLQQVFLPIIMKDKD